MSDQMPPHRVYGGYEYTTVDITPPPMPREAWTVTGGWRMRCTARLQPAAFQERCINNSVINRERCMSHGGLN